MANRTAPLLPSVALLLENLGQRLRMARLRRRLQSKQVAERAGMSVMTLRAIERGSPGVTMGAYIAVMQVLQVVQDIAGIAKDDEMGRLLQDASLVKNLKPRRAPSRSTSKILEQNMPQEKTIVEPNVEVTDGSVSTKELLVLLKKPPVKGWK